MTGRAAFVALGSNAGDPPRRLAAALEALDRDGCRVAACSRLAWTAYVGAPRGVAAPRVLNAVAELRTELAPEALHRRLHALEAAHGRVRDGGVERTLDLDLLAHGDELRRGADLALPHPRCLGRAFVLMPWAEIAPRFVVPGSGATVLEHAAPFLAADPGAPDGAPEPAFPAPFAPRPRELAVLPDRAALDGWRRAQGGSVGVVMTMGALHAGHASLVQRAAAECDAVLATIFVNPTQFAPGEDFARYPRTFEADCALLARHGADAVYAPTVADLYPDGVAADIEPGPAARGYEGASRPAHFRGVATVVTRLWRRARAARSYFGQKDAQQLAVLREVRAAQGIATEVVGCETVREVGELALSSRNAYLASAQRVQAGGLAAALRGLARAAACGGFDAARDLAAAREALRGAGLDVDYVDVVDPDRFTPRARLDGPALAVGAVRLGGVRLIDNRWIAPPPGAHA